MKLDGRGERVKGKSRAGFILDLNHQEGSNTLIGKKEAGSVGREEITEGVSVSQKQASV